MCVVLVMLAMFVVVVVVVPRLLLVRVRGLAVVPTHIHTVAQLFLQAYTSLRLMHLSQIHHFLRRVYRRH